MQIDICFSPALFPTYNHDKNTCVIIVDIFRATTCMCTAFDTGVNSILPLADIEKVKELKSAGFMVGAERNCQRCDFADFGNSPFDYTHEKIKGQDIVMTTTNGTHAIDVACENNKLLIGSFANFSTIATHCMESKQDILILCSGWNDHANIEDTLFAGALAEKLISTKEFTANSDAVAMALALWETAKSDVRTFLNRSEHIKRLLSLNLSADIDYCLTMDTTHSLPYYEKETGKLKNYFHR